MVFILSIVWMSEACRIEFFGFFFFSDLYFLFLEQFMVVSLSQNFFNDNRKTPYWLTAGLTCNSFMWT